MVVGMLQRGQGLLLSQFGIRLQADFHWCTDSAVEPIAAWRCLWAMSFW
jgi:hypothetical protein